MNEDKTSFWTDIKLFEGVLERDPDSYAFIPLSDLYRKLGLFDDALSVAQRGCSRHPTLVSGQLVLGLACHELGLKDECRAALENVIRVTPENLDAQRILSRMYADAGDCAAAEASLRILLALAPNDLESRVIQDALVGTGGEDDGGARSELAGLGENDMFGLEDLPAVSIDEEISFVTGGEDDSFQAGSESTEEVFPTGIEAEADDEEILDLDDTCIIEEFDDVAEGTSELDLQGDAEQTPLVSATMAELYVKQGFNDLAIGVYRQLIAKNPTDTDLLLRLDELLAAGRSGGFEVPPVLQPFHPETDAGQPSGSSADFVAVEVGDNEVVPHRRESVRILEGWLESIRRVKACRSSIH